MRTSPWTFLPCALLQETQILGANRIRVALGEGDVERFYPFISRIRRGFWCNLFLLPTYTINKRLATSHCFPFNCLSLPFNLVLSLTGYAPSPHSPTPIHRFDRARIIYFDRLLSSTLRSFPIHHLVPIQIPRRLFRILHSSARPHLPTDMKSGAAALYTLTLSAISSLAAPISSQQQVVVSPHITAPEEDAFRSQGSRQMVRWDTDKVPQGSLVATGMIVLGYWSPESEGEHLDYEHPLASGFSLAGGSVEIEIPADIQSLEDYFIVLFGDSGNASPSFTIDQAL